MPGRGCANSTEKCPSKTSAKYMHPCKFFLDSKNCRRGDRCKFLHSESERTQPAHLSRHDNESPWVKSQSTLQLGMDLVQELYGGKHCQLLVVGDGDFSFAAHVAESTQAKLVASCQESSDVFHSRQEIVSNCTQLEYVLVLELQVNLLTNGFITLGPGMQRQ